MSLARIKLKSRSCCGLRDPRCQNNHAPLAQKTYKQKGGAAGCARPLSGSLRENYRGRRKVTGGTPQLPYARPEVGHQAGNPSANSVGKCRSKKLHNRLHNTVASGVFGISARDTNRDQNSSTHALYPRYGGLRRPPIRAPTSAGRRIPADRPSRPLWEISYNSRPPPPLSRDPRVVVDDERAPPLSQGPDTPDPDAVVPLTPCIRR